MNSEGHIRKALLFVHDALHSEFPCRCHVCSAHEGNAREKGGGGPPLCSSLPSAYVSLVAWGAVPGPVDHQKSIDFLNLMIDFEVDLAESDGRDPFDALLKRFGKTSSCAGWRANLPVVRYLCSFF